MREGDTSKRKRGSPQSKGVKDREGRRWATDTRMQVRGQSPCGIM